MTTYAATYISHVEVQQIPVTDVKPGDLIHGWHAPLDDSTVILNLGESPNAWTVDTIARSAKSDWYRADGSDIRLNLTDETSMEFADVDTIFVTRKETP